MRNRVKIITGEHLNNRLRWAFWNNYTIYLELRGRLRV